MVNPVLGAGLVVLGYLLGSDGRPTGAMVVCPADGDGRPRLPDSQLARLDIGLGGLGGFPAVLDLETAIERLHENMQPYGTSTTYYLERLLDTRRADKVTFYLDSTLNQAVTVQVVGHTVDAPTDSAGLVNIEASQTLAAGSTAASKLSLGVDLDINWHPYLGVTVAAGGTPPTAGRVLIYAAIRRWTRPFAGQQGA